MKILSFYLPQYYPFPENDYWWGKGFTEWTSVGRAKPLFKGHYQPKVPKDLGYYDLRVPETREEQAKLAKEYGVDGFCYWHYWFGGKRLMNQIIDEVLVSGKPDYPFCFCWANHTWYAKNWNTQDSKLGHVLLIEQTYPGKEDYVNHFNAILHAFKDHRYIKKNNKPVFAVYDADSIPDVRMFMDVWNEMACFNGFNGMYFISYNTNMQKYEKVKSFGFDEYVVDVMDAGLKRPNSINSFYRRFMSHFNLENLLTLKILDYSKYSKVLKDYFTEHSDITICVLPNYDHSPRSGNNALILNNSTPEEFGKLLYDVKNILDKRSSNKDFIFIKSWNEWGEGNYLEPDLKYGRGFLEQIKKVFGCYENR